MNICLISRVLFLGIALIASNAAVAVGMTDFYEEPGLNPNRSLHETDFDAVDPFTGKLQLHQTDISIPGNGGMNLEVTRSYTSGNIWGGGFGYSGWTMDFGYVEAETLNALCSTGLYVSNVHNPVLVTPDGGRQVLADVDTTIPGPPYTFPYITNKFWKATCTGAPTSGGLIVTSPEGTTYEMTLPVYTTINLKSYTRWYVTKITDKNGNWISITYNSPQDNGAPINTVTTNDGRSLTYFYTPPDAFGLVKLASITDGTRTWSYSYIDGSTLGGLPAGTFLLSKVTLPDNTAWIYSYNGSLGLNTNPNLYGGNGIIPGSYQISSVTTPQGGVVNYSYDYVQFNFYGGYETAVTSRAIVGGATWNYSYTPSSGLAVLDKTSVTMNDPVTGAHQTDTYGHFGYNTIADVNEVWKIGLLGNKTIGTKQTEFYTWNAYVVTNRQTNFRNFTWTIKLDYGLYNPVLASKTIVRDGATYTNLYNNPDYFGNAWGQTETGPTGTARTKTFQFSLTSYNDPLWILHQKTYEYYNGLNHVLILDALRNVLMDSKALVTTAYTYNPNGTVATMTPPGGATYTYDSYGNPLSSTTPYGTSYGNYIRGIPQNEVQQNGISLSRVVNNAGDITSETNGNGNTTAYTYDGLNRLTSITHPINNPVSIAYTANSKTATRGALVENTLYDGFGRPIRVTLGGITTTYKYDALGRTIFKSNPNSTAGTSYAYDELGRVTKVTYADGASNTTTYGTLTRTVTDENKNSTVYSYYAYGDPDQTYLTNIATQDPAASIAITRDTHDNISSVTQAGITRNYVIGLNGYLYQQTDPETGITNYNRDDAGNMTARVVNGVGWATYTYDFHNRLKTVATATTSSTNTYSKTSKLLSTDYVTSGWFNGNLYPLYSSTRSFTYDANDNLDKDSLAVDGYTLTTGYAYNANDQTSSITYPISSQTVSFNPDVLGRPTAVSSYVSSATYWPSGQVQQINYQNGTSSSYGQNARLWPSSFSTQGTSGALINSSYVYDPVGNLTSISDSTTPAFNRAFGYDSLDRLTTINASGSWGAGGITYDGAGNITSQTFGTSGITYTYSPQDQLASVAGTLKNASYTYDYGGDVLSDGAGKNFAYDDKQNLVGMTDGNTGASIAYNYDGLNKRVKVQKNGVVTYEFYDLTGKLLAEYTPSQTNKLVEYMYMGGMRIAQKTSNQ